MEFVAGPKSDGCFICDAVTGDDDDRALVLERRELTIVMLNRYPYNTGHLLVAPNQHAATLQDLEGKARAELMETLTRCVTKIQEGMSPEGFNLGANLGEAAGAGVPGHLHLHVVPRWSGDTNFMPVVGGAKVLPETLENTYERMRRLF